MSLILKQRERRKESLATRLAKRQRIGKIHGLLVNQIFEHLKAKKDVVLDLSILLLDLDDFSTYCKFLSQIGVKRVVIPTYIYEKIMTSSIDKLKKIYSSLRLWRDDLPPPDQLFKEMKDKFQILKGSFEVISIRVHIQGLNLHSTFEYNLKNLLEKIDGGFKKAYTEAAEMISEILIIASMRGIEVISKGETLLRVASKGFKEKVRQITVFETKVQLAKTTIKILLVIIVGVEIKDLEPTLVNMIVKFLQEIQTANLIPPLDPSLNINFPSLQISPELLRKYATALVVCP